jgi:hypothetical protein
MERRWDLSVSGKVFRNSMNDAEATVGFFEHFSKMHGGNPPEETEVLKRAGLIMAMVAWETYVEDCIRECVETRIASGVPEFAVEIIRQKLESDLKQFNNPDTGKTRKLFKDYAGVDVTMNWSEADKTNLNEWITLRGDVAHRSPHRWEASAGGKPHVVTIAQLKKIINGLYRLMESTDQTLVDAGVLKKYDDEARRREMLK